VIKSSLQNAKKDGSGKVCFEDAEHNVSFDDDEDNNCGIGRKDYLVRILEDEHVFTTNLISIYLQQHDQHPSDSPSALKPDIHRFLRAVFDILHHGDDRPESTTRKAGSCADWEVRSCAKIRYRPHPSKASPVEGTDQGA
jgi:hypothetical protein